MNTSPIPMIELYKSIKSGNVSVTLDGHGADEMFCGYGQDIYKAAWDFGLNFSKLNELHKCYVNTMDVGSSQLKVESRNIYNPQVLISVLKRSFGSKRGLYDAVLSRFSQSFSIRRSENDILNGYNGYLYEIFHETILPTLLRNYDRYSMAASVEVRMPFMDHRLVSLAFSLPWDSKLRNGYTKAILRDSLVGIMPEKIRTRTSKIGFNTPIVDWMRGPWREFILDSINSNEFNHSEFIDRNKVKRQVNDVIYGQNPSFFDGVSSWTSLTPFFWEKFVLNRFKDENNRMQNL
jgi:asparagine synthase (glutamine-hydrolysing)